MKLLPPSLFHPNATLVSRILFLGYALFLLGYLVVPKTYEGSHFKFYYAGVFFPALFKFRHGLHMVRGDRLFLLLILYLLYMLSSMIWSEQLWASPEVLPETLKEAWRACKYAALIVVFVLATVVLSNDYPARFDALLRAATLIAAGSAIVAILLWYRSHPFPQSLLQGFTLMRNPNDTAFVYGFFAVLAMAFALGANERMERILWSLAVLVLLCAVTFTQSRGGLGATLIGVLVLLRGISWRNAVYVLSVILLGFVTLVALLPEIPAHMVHKGLSHRMDIWSIVMDRAMQAPWFGHGYLCESLVDIPASHLHYHAHNAYLATLRDGGLVGLLLLLALFGYALLRALRVGLAYGNYRYLALLLFGLICVTTSVDRLIDRPKEVWVIIWLPLALLLSKEGRSLLDRPLIAKRVIQ